MFVIAVVDGAVTTTIHVVVFDFDLVKVICNFTVGDRDGLPPFFLHITMNLQCLSPITIPNPNYGTYKELYTGSTRFISVPCGKCPACLMKRKNEWTNRLLLESSISYNNYFFTLTYDELHEPYRESEIYGFVPVHRYSDFQDFIKRLRYNLYGSKKGDLRFIVTSEYGPATFRPHYHGIFFNVPQDCDIQTEILRAWQNGIECPAGPLSDGGASYCCKYMFKQQEYLQGQPKNFIRTSQRPPIGFGAITPRQIQFLIENATDLYRNPKTLAFSLPRSFKSKIFDRAALLEISSKKTDAYNDKMADTLESLKAKMGDEHGAFKLLAEFRRQQWTLLNRISYKTTHKKSKI